MKEHLWRAARVAAMILAGAWATAAFAVELEAGPIWSNDDAQAKCTNVCGRAGQYWDGNWRTVGADRSVCSCSAERRPGRAPIARYENTDFSFSDLPDGHTDASSFEDCANQCLAVRECVAFTFSPARVCYKKSGAGNVMEVRDATSGFVVARGVPPQSLNGAPPAGSAAMPPPPMSVMPGALPYVRYDRTDMPFNDIAELDRAAGSFEDCAARCLGDRRCVAFTFNNSSRACKAKSAASQTAPNNYVSTGVVNR